MMLVSWSLLALSAVLPSAAITVNGDATCPLPSDVAVRLSSLLPGASATDAGAPSESAGDGGDVARIDTAEDALEIVLRRSDGTLIGRRRLLAEGTCDERARAVAIVLATWESDVHPAFRGPVPQPPPTPARPVAPAAAGGGACCGRGAASRAGTGSCAHAGRNARAATSASERRGGVGACARGSGEGAGSVGFWVSASPARSPVAPSSSGVGSWARC